jgi:hypothetical protein
MDMNELEFKQRIIIAVVSAATDSTLYDRDKETARRAWELAEKCWNEPRHKALREQEARRLAEWAEPEKPVLPKM